MGELPSAVDKVHGLATFGSSDIDQMMPFGIFYRDGFFFAERGIDKEAVMGHIPSSLSF